MLWGNSEPIRRLRSGTEGWCQCLIGSLVGAASRSQSYAFMVAVRRLERPAGRLLNRLVRRYVAVLQFAEELFAATVLRWRRSVVCTVFVGSIDG